MPKYQVVVTGENFLVNLGEGLMKHRFVTYQCVEADNPELAEDLAIEQVRRSQELQALVENDRDDTPTLLMTEMHECESFVGFELLDGFEWSADPAPPILPNDSPAPEMAKKWWQIWKK